MTKTVAASTGLLLAIAAACGASSTTDAPSGESAGGAAGYGGEAGKAGATAAAGKSGSTASAGTAGASGQAGAGIGGASGGGDGGVDASDANADTDASNDVVDASMDVLDASNDVLDASNDVVDETPPPTGKILPIVPCNETLDAVYVAPGGLPPMTPAHRGDVVRCAGDTLLDVATVQQQLDAKALPDVIATTGTQLVRIAYRTERADGVAGIGTARVYLPTTPLPAPIPLIVIAHPSEGLADGCAPSRNPSSLQDLALPWAARGYAVIAPDYAGLGNEGTQGYLDNRDTAHSVLDAARALRKMLTKGWLSPKVAIFGHSQGGGAALSAQALAASYGLDGELAAVAVFAPEWPSRLASFGFLQLLAQPTTPTVFTGITKPVVAELLAYARSRNGGATPYDQVAPMATAAGLADAAETQCLQAYGGYLQGVALTVGDLFSTAERDALTACVAAKGGAGCAPPGKDLYDFLASNVLAGDPKGAKILYVQGLLDTIMPPAEEAACNLGKLAIDGVFPQVCTDQTGIHTNVVVNNIVFSMKWAEAVLAGAPPPTCDASGMPSCTLP